jgi:hypothetical protein
VENAIKMDGEKEFKGKKVRVLVKESLKLRVMKEKLGFLHQKALFFFNYKEINRLAVKHQPSI